MISKEKKVTIIRGLSDIKQQYQRSIVTIGNFDGVHSGHQSMIKQLVQDADEQQVLAGVITFEPHPAEFFKSRVSLARLTPLREKYNVLRTMGIDFILVLPFNKMLAQKSAKEFIDIALVKKLAIQGLWVGDDFRFGKDREGDFALLQAMAQENNFIINQSNTVIKEGDRVSSTLIREQLQAGNLEKVTSLLGRAYSISGRVQHGEKRGRQLGFPTANIHLPTWRVPLSGVFTVLVQSDAFEGVKYGVANCGTRPTVNGKGRLLEVHLLDFEGSLYGHRLEVQLRKKLRDEKKFGSLTELKEQIGQDILEAKKLITLEENIL